MKTNRLYFMLWIILLVIIVYYSQSFILGEMFPTRNKNPDNPAYLDIGNYNLLEISHYLNSKNVDFRIILLPYRDRNMYYGSPCTSRPLLPYIVHKNFLAQFFGKAKSNSWLLQNLMVSNLYYSGLSNISKALALLNTRYIIQRNNYNYDYYPGVDTPVFTKECLGRQKGIDFVKCFGKLDLYKISDEYFLPHIYPSTTPTIVDGDIEDIVSLTETKYLDGKPALFFNTQDVNKALIEKKDIPKLVFSRNEWKLLGPASSIKDPGSRIEPKITFQKINPTKYRVKIKNAKEPFWLVFSESFHPGWRLYQLPITPKGKSKISYGAGNYQLPEFDNIVAEYPRLEMKEARHLQKFTPLDIKYLFRQSDIKEHYLVNGYANAWYVPVSQFTRSPVSQFPPKADQPQAETNQPTNKLTNQPTNEMEIVLYFWPQTLFYLGLFISGTTFLGCITYLVYSSFKKKGKKSVGNSIEV